MSHVPPRHRPRPLALARAAATPQPAAILTTIGMIAALIMLWTGLMAL